MGFFGDFMGTSQQKDIRNADAKATASLATGYRDANQRYDQANALYDPYVQQGQAASSFYQNALGLNGDAARSQAQSTITSDPLFQGKFNQDQNALLTYMNARGDAGGGRAYAAGQQNLYQNYGNWLDRYKEQGNQGFQATGQQAGIRQGQGDMAMGYGATKAGQQINYGNALAQSRGIGVNNLMGLVGTAAKAYSAMYKPA
jgi:hypothetical protein